MRKGGVYLNVKVRGQTKNSFLRYIHFMLYFMFNKVYVNIFGQILVFS